MPTRVFTTMGTVVSLRTDEPLADVVVDWVRETFDRFDAQFSLYRDDSEISRLAAGDLRLGDTSDTFRRTYADALEWRSATSGLFTPHRPDGVIDLSGIVKAAAIADAGTILDTAVTGDWILNCGGDVLMRSSAPTAVGITDPHAPGRIATALTVAAPRRAVASSGSAERGEHIWGVATGIAQATVVADDIVMADVLATAIVAGGTELLDTLTMTHRIDALVIAPDGAISATPGIRLADPSFTTGVPEPADQK
ncbi:FAD:protein FMN transferase [Schumannella soli]|uniref:FAD:protein FMN transferase n=1 Tax=Schumannella soli TaxID=2590779 RepID=A0A506XNF5_9MICO|nr:FAD:protein FMN transferase [Schumannella soli]TPW74194.1 FAD:protein FMN transferase [Schumannella soli]